MAKNTKQNKRYKFLNKNTGNILIFAVCIILSVFTFMYFQSKYSRPQKISNSDSIISGSFDKSKMKAEAEWKSILTPDQYYILRQQGTEVPFTGALEYENRKGTYYSVGCNEPVFRSEQKYNSGTGWPSFWAPISNNALILRVDNSLQGITRVEVVDKCGGHLGHVFDDGPNPTGKRYCINSTAMYFIPDKKQN